MDVIFYTEDMYSYCQLDIYYLNVEKLLYIFKLFLE